MPAPSPRPPEPAPPRAGGDPGEAAEWSGRALAAGLAVGAFLAVGNLYMGLKTGWWDSGHVTASVLTFALVAARGRGARLSPLENNLAQSAATAVGATPASFNLLGAVPALALLGVAVPPAWVTAALGLALATLGILLALALRRRLLDDEQLPFPTGVATAEVIDALHARRGGSRPARTLAVTGAAAGLITAARELLPAAPQAIAPPVSLLGTPASALGLGLAVNPMLLGAGLVAGVRNGLSALLGAALAWAVFAPRLVRSGVAGASYGELVAWLAWPGVGLVLGAALVSVAGQWRAFAGAWRDLRDLARRGDAVRDRRRAALLALGAAAAVVPLAGMAYGLRPAGAVAALALGVALTAACARAVGQTDMMPAGETAQVAQVALGSAGAAGANVGAAAVAAGMSAQAGASLWSLRAGQLLGATPRLQGRAMLAGALLGAGVTLPIYAALVRAWGVGTAALPVPGAVPWRVIGELVTRGGAALPPGALGAALAGVASGVALELAGRRLHPLPSASAVGMGFLVPAHYAATLCLGGLVGAAWRRLRPASAAELVPAAGAGAIAGESLVGAAVATLMAAGVVAGRAP